MPPTIPPFSSDIAGLRGRGDSDPAQNDSLPDNQPNPPAYKPDHQSGALDATMARSRIIGVAPNPPAPSLQDIENGTAKLQPGQQGPAVADIQKMLHMKPTGVYDAATQAAVKTFQTDHGLHSKTNEVGQQTLNALQHPQHPPAPSLKDIENGSAKLQAGQQGPAVADMQKMLGMKPTGIYDGATQQAVKQFQSQHGLHSDSLEVGRDTLRAMEQATRPPASSQPATPHQAERSSGRPQPQEHVSEHVPQHTSQHVSQQHHPQSPADKNTIDARLQKFEKDVKDALPHIPTAKDAENLYKTAVGKVQQLEKSATKALENLPKSPTPTTATPPPSGLSLPSLKDLSEGARHIEQKVGQKVDDLSHQVQAKVHQEVHAVEQKVYDKVHDVEQKLKKDLDS